MLQPYKSFGMVCAKRRTNHAKPSLRSGADLKVKPMLCHKGGNMEIEIETNFIPLILAYDLPDDITKRITPTLEKRDGISEPIASAVFIIGAGASAQILGMWLYDKLKKHKDRAYIKIEHEEVTIDEANIIRVIKSKIEIKK